MPIQNDAKMLKKYVTETLAHGYSPESTKGALSNEYQHDRVLDGYEFFLYPSALDESSLSIEGVKIIFPPNIF